MIYSLKIEISRHDFGFYCYFKNRVVSITYYFHMIFKLKIVTSSHVFIAISRCVNVCTLYKKYS